VLDVTHQQRAIEMSRTFWKSAFIVKETGVHMVHRQGFDFPTRRVEFKVSVKGSAPYAGLKEVIKWRDDNSHRRSTCARSARDFGLDFALPRQRFKLKKIRTATRALSGTAALLGLSKVSGKGSRQHDGDGSSARIPRGQAELGAGERPGLGSRSQFADGNGGAL